MVRDEGIIIPSLILQIITHIHISMWVDWLLHRQLIWLPLISKSPSPISYMYCMANLAHTKMNKVVVYLKYVGALQKIVVIFYLSSS